jgi:hypothetical protein
VGVGVGLGDGVGVGLGVGEGVAVGLGDGEGLGSAVGLGEGLSEGIGEGVVETVGSSDWLSVGIGLPVGSKVLDSPLLTSPHEANNANDKRNAVILSNFFICYSVPIMGACQLYNITKKNSIKLSLINECFRQANINFL